MRRSTLAGLAVAAAAFLFGSTFVVIKDAVSGYPPVNFVAWRFLLGGTALALLSLPRGRRIWRDATVTGLILCAGYAAQTAGLVVTGASNSALITGLFVIITPILAAAFNRRAPGGWVMVGAALAFMGVLLLTARGGLALNRGDLLTLVCALAFAGHIVALSRFAPRHRVVPFTAAQLLVTAAVAFPLAAALEGIQTPSRREAPALVLTALGVSGGAFLLQIWAQTVIGPGRTGILLALEPAFAVATAVVVLGETLSATGWLGAALIVGAIYLVVTRGEERAEQEAEAITAAH
jgi:drug/metabolite transporter (DMT)-like permease